jgi:hypothetical protein
MLLNFSPL